LAAPKPICGHRHLLARKKRFRVEDLARGIIEALRGRLVWRSGAWI